MARPRDWSADFEVERKTSRCPVEMLMDRMEQGQREAFTSALTKDQRDLSNLAILRVVRQKWGMSLGTETLRRHRTGKCSCRTG